MKNQIFGIALESIPGKRTHQENRRTWRASYRRGHFCLILRGPSPIPIDEIRPLLLPAIFVDQCPELQRSPAKESQQNQHEPDRTGGDE